MRRPRWNAEQVSCRNLLANTTLNRTIALLVRRNGLAVSKRAAYEERGGTGLHKDNVHLRLMPLRLSIRFTTNKEDRLVGEICELLDGGMMGIRCCLLCEALGSLIYGRSRPEIESLR